jgi:hypothetical protein
MPNYIASSSCCVRCVYQGDKLFFKQDLEQVDVSGTASREDTHQGYDGEMMRILEQNVVGNIRNDRVDDGRLVRPHNLLLQRTIGSFPLARLLKGGRAAREFPGFRDAEIAVRYDGDEVVDALTCHRLRLEYLLDSWKDGKGPSVRLLWVAPERNYLPIRTEWYFRGQWKPGAAPSEIGHVKDLREIAPGIWFPFRAVSTVFQQEDSKQQVVNRSLYTVEKAELDPRYDASLFRDIPFPDGAVVYEIENGKIVKSYVKG